MLRRARPALPQSIDANDPVQSDVRSVFPATSWPCCAMAWRWMVSRSNHAQVDWQNPEQLRFVLTEGKKRQIRPHVQRAVVGLKVVGLSACAWAGVLLGQLPAGQWRYLAPGESL